ncbi:carbohydrate ABC transporter permease [Curtobacterium luteum]|uniref:carbohydrate ABC transporter permease n=1 Tax=Curtobacterium luteum TaxID=33881 RepID=UPI0009FAB38E|nr:carbohydrate ABC transporter permease [Curtobacterium luteum]
MTAQSQPGPHRLTTRSAGTAPHRRRPAGRARSLFVLRTVVAVVVALIVIAPLYWMVVVAFSPRSELLGGTVRFFPRTLTLENLDRVFSSFPVVEWLGNSTAIAVSVAVLTTAISLLAGYAFAQLRFRGSTVLFFIALATLAVPVQVIMVSLFRIVTGLHLYGTYWAVILPSAASAFGVFLARQFLLGIPKELIEAARIDGAGHAGVFFRIVLPMSRPLIAVLFFMSLLQAWNDFAWPLIALRENRLFTLPIGLLYLQGQFGSDYGATMAFALLDVVPILVVFLVFQRWFVQGFARSGLR